MRGGRVPHPDEGTPSEGARPAASHNQPVRGVHHRWPLRRTSKAFRCGVVEPSIYAPSTHTDLFLAEMQRLQTPSFVGLDAPEVPPAEPLDLITWPEALLPADTLVAVLEGLAQTPHFPCIHVGLRADGEPNTSHLFRHEQLLDLVARLRRLSPMIEADLGSFADWLAGAPLWGRYNVACLFFIDAEGDLRVCLHPKNTASPLELSGLPEETVYEANFTAIVTLTSTNRALFDVHIQPLICSDLLDLPRATQDFGPRVVINSDPERIGLDVPEHIDLVSVATCTPQANDSVGQRPPSPVWQPHFRTAFLEPLTGGALIRHAWAVVVLANFRLVLERAGGLSGCYVPRPLPPAPHFGEFARVWSWGRDGGDRRWEFLDGGRAPKEWSSSAHLMTLEPTHIEREGAEDHLLAFTINRFPRNCGPMDTAPTLTNLTLTPLVRTRVEALAGDAR